MELLLILELLLGTVPLLPQLVVLLVPVSEGLAKWSIAEVQVCIAREIDVLAHLLETVQGSLAAMRLTLHLKVT